MMDLKLKAPYRSVHAVLKKQPPRWISRILSLSGDEIDEAVTDDRELYRQMLEAVQSNGKKDLHCRLYSDSLVSMEKVYSLEREMDRALGKRVNLKSGADLVIESTEALHIIDVNSGRSRSSKHKEEALLAVNLEAAREAARQIRLRNLSGIIVIDFINLKEQKNSLRILDELRKAVFQDPVRTQVVDMTKLGLVEMTRQKIEVPLREALMQGKS
jgi:ribonuclease G